MNSFGNHPIKTGSILLLAFFVGSLFLIFQYAEKERKRDLMSWQSRLAIVADMRKAAVEEWLLDRKTKLKELASNPTLQLYLSQPDLDKNSEISKAQFSHVRNLLHATSKRFDFNGRSQNSINTEYDDKARPGLAVLSKTGELLFSTKGFSKELSHYELLIKNSLETGKEAFVDMFKADEDIVFYGFVMPVFHIQKMQYQNPVGAVIVLLNPQNKLFSRLKNLHLDTKSDETVLVKTNNDSVAYISPLVDGYQLFHQMSKLNKQLAANFSIGHIGDFALKKDYRNKDVLVTGRAIKGTPWTLIQKIDADEALEESNAHQRFLLTTFTLLALFLVAMFVAVWRHSTSVRLQRITAALETRTALLNAVSDNINDHIFLLDEKEHFVFANLSLAQTLNINTEDFVGKTIASVIGPEVSERLNALSCEDSNETQGCVVTMPIGDEEKTYHVSSLVLQQGEYKNAKLYVLHDMTGLKKAQEKRDRLARGIISTLVRAVDLHDPFCVDHSERTREVAVSIAQALKLESGRCETLELAALLANIGKLFVPQEILTKMEALSEEESEQLKKHIDYAVDILKQLEFEGPVVEIISQKHESLDGSGYPRGLAGEQILLESRILAVANAFVAMASSRAYREGRPIKDVLDILHEQSEKQYDRHVVAALFHIAENKSDWEKWQTVSQ